MTYSKTFNLERYEVIEPALKAMKKLDPGQEATITCPNPEALSRTRVLLYDYLYHTGLKADFRLKVLSPTRLLILRLRSELVEKVESERLAPYVEEVIDRWEDQNAVEEYLKELVTNGELNLVEADSVKAQVEEIMR